MSPSATARQRKLGLELKRLREREGLSSQEAADRLAWSQSKLSRIETARQRPSIDDVNHALDMYGTDSGTRAALLQLAQAAQQRGWWVEYGDVFVGSYVGFEDVATHISVFETILIPGLLQTVRYARAVIEAWRPDDPSDVDRRVRARLARQVLLAKPDAPELHAVIDEAALRRPVGGREVMREQLRALLPSADRPNVSIRVIPFHVGAHGGMDGPFTILSFGEDPDMAYVDSRAGSAYLESSSQMRSVTLAFERLWNAALSVGDSAAYIAAIAKE